VNLPAHSELVCRARWLAQLEPEQRASLEELPMSLIEALYAAWCAQQRDERRGSMAA